MPELERGERVAVDHGLLDRGLARQVAVDHLARPSIEAAQPGRRDRRRRRYGPRRRRRTAADCPGPRPRPSRCGAGRDRGPGSAGASAGEPRQRRLRDLEIGDDPLHVVVVVQRLEQLEQASRPCSSSSGTVTCGFQLSPACSGGPKRASSCSCTAASSSGGAGDLVALLGTLAVVGTGLDRGLEHRVGRWPRSLGSGSGPTRSNWKLTLLVSPSAPPCLPKVERTSLAVRLRLSVSASTITATPPGP